MNGGSVSIDKDKLKEHINKDAERMEEKLKNVSVTIVLKAEEIAAVFSGLWLIVAFGGRGREVADSVSKKLTAELQKIDADLVK